MPSITIDELSARDGASYRWLILLTGMIGNMALILTSTIINVAIPDIMGAFGIG